ncbi:MAG: peptidylprolyl isomerase [Gaiellaceae bacterium]
MRTRRLILFLVLALVAGTLLAACGSAKKNDVPAGAVAIVGNQPITTAQFDALMAQAKQQYTQNKKTFPAVGSKDYQTLKDQAVAYLVRKSAIIQQATKMGVKVSDAEVANSLKQTVAQQYGGSQKKFDAALAKDHVTQAQATQLVRENLIDQAAYAALVKNVVVSQSEIKDYYNAHKSSYQVGLSREVSHILVKTKAQADSIYQQLKAGGNFAKLAKKYSTDTTTKSKGGALGAMEQKKLVKPFADVLFSNLKTNTFSKPVKSSFGWHIILPTGPIVKAHLQPLKDVSATIRQTLLTSKQSAAVSDWVKKAEKYAADNTNYAASYKPTTTTSSSTVSTTTTP